MGDAVFEYVSGNTYSIPNQLSTHYKMWSLTYHATGTVNSALYWVSYLSQSHVKSTTCSYIKESIWGPAPITWHIQYSSHFPNGYLIYHYHRSTDHHELFYAVVWTYTTGIVKVTLDLHYNGSQTYHRAMLKVPVVLIYRSQSENRSLSHDKLSIGLISRKDIWYTPLQEFWQRKTMYIT